MVQLSTGDLNRLEEERDMAMLAQAVAGETEFYSVAEVEAGLARVESIDLRAGDGCCWLTKPGDSV